MGHATVSEHLAEPMKHLYRHWESQRKAVSARGERTLLPHSFTIVISREAGTQGTAISQEVGKRLGWQVYDHELLEQIAQDMRLRAALLESVDERHQSWLTETFEAFMSASGKSEWEPLVSESAYVHHLVRTVLALGAHGECVIVGRGAPFILPVETTLRVRLVGPVRERIAALSRKLSLAERKAELQIRTIDRERTDFVQDHFFKDPTDPRNYDLVLNVFRLSVGSCSDLIVDTLHLLEARG